LVEHGLRVVERAGAERSVEAREKFSAAALTRLRRSATFLT
jgi:hypothetical protein